jgi:hypothetical protein
LAFVSPTGKLLRLFSPKKPLVGIACVKSLRRRPAASAASEPGSVPLYGVLIGSVLPGIALNLTPLDPIKALHWGK